MTLALPAYETPKYGTTKSDVDCAIAQKLFEAKQYETALATVNVVLDDEPDHPWALTLGGRIALMMQKPGLGYNLLKRAMAALPKSDIKRNYAAACIGVLRLDEAKRVLHELRKERPNDEKALALLCLLSVYECDPEKAIELGEQSLAMKPGQKDVHESLGYANLMLGRFEKGWDGYEKFIGASKYRPNKPPYEGCPYWDGSEDIDLYLRGEQGIGDELSFASIIPEVVPKLRSLTFDCDEKLGGLFQRSFRDVEIHPTRKTRSADKPWLAKRKFDAWGLVGSLAYHHRKTAASFPGTPYLVADPERRVQWRALLDTLPGKKKVGIAWTGGSRNTFKARRSLTLDDLLPLLRLPDVSWVSLQYQDPTDDIGAFHDMHGIEIHHWARCTESPDYDDTAALVAELDLVIAVPTAVCHLAGGLGKECWALTPLRPNWFWGLKDGAMPWHSSIKIIRRVDESPPDKEVRAMAIMLKDRL